MRTTNQLPKHTRVDYKLNNELGWFNLNGIYRTDFNYLLNDLIIEDSNHPCPIYQGVTECIKGRQKKTLAEITSDAVQYCNTKKG
jgi:hypothetical protein